MSGPLRPWRDEDVEEVVGLLLRVGVLLAASIVLIGGAIYVARHGTAAPNYRAFHGEPTDLRGVAGITSDARGFGGRGIIQLGLLVLVATPVARVAFSVFAFARERDWLYVIVTLIVLGVLAFSLGGSGG